MLILSETDVKKCLSVSDCLEANRTALRAVSEGTAIIPKRISLPFQEPRAEAGSTPDCSLFKPAAYPADNLMGMKVISLRAANPGRGLPLAGASILHMNPTTGAVDAVVAGTFLTALRTACGSALSCQIMKPEAKRLTCFGAGLQADLHVKAVSAALKRPLEVTIVNRNLDRAESLKSQLLRETSNIVSSIDIVELSDRLGIHTALSETDIVVTCTNTVTPLFEGSGLRPGTHVCGVGSYTPDMQEISASVVARCSVFVDTPEAKLVGDLRHLAENHPIVLIGSLLGDAKETTSTDHRLRPAHLDCTFYKSVGTAIQDVVTAARVFERAQNMGVGSQVDMS